MLDLAKIAIVCRHGLVDLQTQRRHGASWSGISAPDDGLLNDHIAIQPRGAIAIFYRLLTDESAPLLQLQVLLGDIYPLIESVGFEFHQAYSIKSALHPVRVYLNQVDGEGWNVEVTPMIGDPRPLSLQAPFLGGLHDCRNGKASGSVVASDAASAHAALGAQIKW